MKLHQQNFTQKYFSVLIVVLVGFGLRVHELGQDSFWNDEAGQALVSIQTDFFDMLEGIRSHVMAMPLDYMVTRFFGTLSATEFVMRFPAVIWGTLSLSVLFVLARRFLGLQPALLAVLIFALSPIHIRYSQELRFYSALQFFYLLSFFAMYRTLHKDEPIYRTIYILITFLGSYFHPYVMLSLFHGFAMLLFLQLPLQKFVANLLRLAGCGAILTILFLPGYLYFGSHENFDYELFQWGSAATIVLRGFGWFSFQYTPNTPLVGEWELANIVFTGLGLLFLVRERKNSLALALILGLALNVLAIMLASYVKGYWFSFRQIIHLAWIPMMIAAWGGYQSARLFGENIRSKGLDFTKYVNGWPILFFLILGFFVWASLPRLQDYYAYQRSSAKEVVLRLMAQYKPGDEIFVIPGYEEKIYRFYLSRFDFSKIVEKIHGVSWEDLPQWVLRREGRVYLITPAYLSEERQTFLQDFGFVNVLGLDNAWYGKHALFFVNNRYVVCK